MTSPLENLDIYLFTNEAYSSISAFASKWNLTQIDLQYKAISLWRELLCCVGG